MQRDLEKLSDTEYDVIIVGAGIYGVNAAWDAALRGLRVALIDKGDFVNATSSNSLKIIHGGLRYLQHLDVKRMRESIYERMVLMKIAPHLVYPLPVVMPTYNYKMKSRGAMLAALLVNDLIGLDRNRLNDQHKYIPRGRLISKEKIKEYIPNYENSNVTGGALWYDCQCYNTERLALSYVLTAHDAGADIANYVECIGFLGDGYRVSGVKAKDCFTGDVFDIRSKIVVNMGGPWVDTILKNFNGRQLKKRFIHSSAMNIIVNKKLFNTHAVGLSCPYQFKRADGTIYKGNRIVFFVPWRDCTIIGTNHLPYNGDPNGYRIKEAEIQQFLNTVNQAHPAANIRRQDISFFHGGLLPMVGTTPHTGEVRLLRKYGIYDHLREEDIDGLITVVGVKYTTHRDVASKTIDLVFRKLGMAPPRCMTDKTPVYGGEIAQFEDYLKDANNKSGLNEKVMNHLVRNYGSRHTDILSHGKKDSAKMKTVAGSEEILKAEIIHSVQKEMALKLSDVVLRRTDLGSKGFPGDSCLREVAEIMATELHWDEVKINKEIQDIKTIYSTSY